MNRNYNFHWGEVSAEVEELATLTVQQYLPLHLLTSVAIRMAALAMSAVKHTMDEAWNLNRKHKM